jgi:hypothetical protein
MYVVEEEKYHRRDIDYSVRFPLIRKVPLRVLIRLVINSERIMT